MYLCVLSSLPEENDPPYDPSPHLEGRKWRHHVVQRTKVEDQIKSLMDDGVDVFINLCDGTPDEPVSGIQLVKALEKLGAAFTGADSTCFDPTRQEMKRVAARVGVPTPASTFVKSMADVWVSFTIAASILTFEISMPIKYLFFVILSITFSFRTGTGCKTETFNKP